MSARKKPRRNKPQRKPTQRKTPAQVTPPRIARVAKGKKPQYFSDPATDKLLAMTLTLMEELSVTRERLDALERLLASKRVMDLAELEGWKPDADATLARNAARASYVERMMRSMHAELEEIAGRGMPKNEAEVVAAVES